jgi:hypothetical protein
MVSTALDHRARQHILQKSFAEICSLKICGIA